MTLSASFRRIRPACDFQSLTPEACSIKFQDGFAYARNLELMAKVPFDGVPDCYLPVTELQTALRAFPDATVARATPKSVIVEMGKGKAKATVPRLDLDLSFDDPNADKQPVPSQLGFALTRVAPFASVDRARPWSMGARIDDQVITTTNGTTVAQGDLGESSPFEGVTIPDALLKFMVSNRDSLTHWGLTDDEIVVWLDHGGWVRASRLNVAMPDRILQILDDHWAPGDFDITEWKAEVLERLALVDSLVNVEPTRIHGAKDATILECFVQSPIEDDMTFGKEFLDVLRVSNALNWDDEGPLSFSGPNVRGLIIARSNR